MRGSRPVPGLPAPALSGYAYQKATSLVLAGEYGGGTVIVWDRGRWKPIGDPHKGFAKGHLEFEPTARSCTVAGIWSA